MSSDRILFRRNPRIHYQSKSIYEYGRDSNKEYVYFFYYNNKNDYLAMIIFSHCHPRIGALFGQDYMEFAWEHVQTNKIEI